MRVLCVARASEDPQAIDMRNTRVKHPSEGPECRVVTAGVVELQGRGKRWRAEI